MKTLVPQQAVTAKGDLPSLALVEIIALLTAKVRELEARLLAGGL